MSELFKVSSIAQVTRIADQPFACEADFEEFIAQNAELLGEGTEILGRQVNAGVVGRIDLLLIDKTLAAGQIAVAELKNEPADVNVLLQVLRYASWVVSNPDSIRLLLEKARVKSAEVELKPKIVVVAPAVQDALVELSQYVSAFDFDLIELRRFQEGAESFVVVSHKAALATPPPGIRWQDDWSWEKYAAELGWKPERIQLGRALLAAVEKKVQEKGWPLRHRFRKGYIPFQVGAKNVVGVEPRWAQGFSVWFRLTRPPHELGVATPGGLQVSWSATFKTYYVNITDAEFDLDVLDPLFVAAYESASGVP